MSTFLKSQELLSQVLETAEIAVIWCRASTAWVFASNLFQRVFSTRSTQRKMSLMTMSTTIRRARREAGINTT